MYHNVVTKIVKARFAPTIENECPTNIFTELDFLIQAALQRDSGQKTYLR